MTQTIYTFSPALSTELDALEGLLSKEFPGGGFLKAASSSLVLGSGKRLRPALVIAAAHMGSYRRESALPLAAAIEVLHTATLAHDDVIDEAATRRGRPTLHAAHGNHLAIYTGDYLLARSLSLVAKSGLPATDMARIAHAMEQLCAGEVAQYTGRNRVPGPREYLKRIMGKTGVLFAAACAVGGRIGGLPESDVDRLWRVGMRLGTAFQIRDDLLDVTQSAGKAGKPTVRDLLDGIVTLPVLLAAANADYRAALEAFLGGEHNQGTAAALLDAAYSSGAMQSSRQILQQQLMRCRDTLERFPQSPGRDMLQRIAALIGETDA